jgi:hypothetical protein
MLKKSRAALALLLPASALYLYAPTFVLLYLSL